MNQNLLNNIRKIVARNANICTCKVNQNTNIEKLGLVNDKFNKLRTEIENEYNLQPTLYEWKTVLDIYNFLNERV